MDFTVKMVVTAPSHVFGPNVFLAALLSATAKINQDAGDRHHKLLQGEE